MDFNTSPGYLLYQVGWGSFFAAALVSIFWKSRSFARFATIVTLDIISGLIFLQAGADGTALYPFIAVTALCLIRISQAKK